MRQVELARLADVDRSTVKRLEVCSDKRDTALHAKRAALTAAERGPAAPAAKGRVRGGVIRVTIEGVTFERQT